MTDDRAAPAADSDVLPSRREPAAPGTGLHRVGAFLWTVLVLLVVLLTLIGAAGITKFIGEKGNKIMMKLMGLIVMVIAVEFFFSGLKPYIHMLLNP